MVISVWAVVVSKVVIIIRYLCVLSKPILCVFVRCFVVLEQVDAGFCSGRPR